MRISEQVKELREFGCFGTVKQAMLEAADTIEVLCAKLADMERSAEDCGGGWIPCSVDHMPHRGSAVLIRLRNVCDGITGDDDYTYDISFLRTDKNEWISSCGTYPFEDVKAWRPITGERKE